MNKIHLVDLFIPLTRYSTYNHTDTAIIGVIKKLKSSKEKKLHTRAAKNMAYPLKPETIQNRRISHYYYKCYEKGKN